MASFCPRVLAFLKSEDGPTAVEYGIMLALMIIVMMSAITAVGNATSGTWSSNVDQLNNAMNK